MHVKKSRHDKKNKNHKYISYMQYQKYFFATKKPAPRTQVTTYFFN